MTNPTDTDLEIANKIGELSEKFVGNEQFDSLRTSVAAIIERRIADIENDRISKVRSIAISGASGAGKSTVVTRLSEQAREMIFQSSVPNGRVVSVTIPSPATFKYVGQRLLRELGYNLTAERPAWYIWDLVRRQLHEGKVLLLHLDEAQGLMAKGANLNDVVDMLKTLMNDPDWPVALILSGTEKLEDILSFDPQLRRRVRPVRYRRLSYLDADKAQAVIAGHCGHLGTEVSDMVASRDHAERLIHSADCQFGLTIEIMVEAMEKMLRSGQSTLQICHFSDVFLDRTGCDDAFNPFLASDYTRIDVRKLFSGKDIK